MASTGRDVWDDVGVQEGVTADPAANTNPAAVTVTTGQRWLLISASATIVTDANAANRYPYLEITSDGTNAIDEYMATTPTTASLTQTITFGGGATGGAIGNGLMYSIPIPSRGIEIPGGGKFQVKFLNIQATDNCGVVRYRYKALNEY